MPPGSSHAMYRCHWSWENQSCKFLPTSTLANRFLTMCEASVLVAYIILHNGDSWKKKTIQFADTIKRFFSLTTADKIKLSIWVSTFTALLWLMQQSPCHFLYSSICYWLKCFKSFVLGSWARIIFTHRLPPDSPTKAIGKLLHKLL